MSISVSAISFDAHDAAGLVHFWAQALHRTVNDGATEEFASIAAGTDSRLGAMLMFHKVPESKTVKNFQTVFFGLNIQENLTRTGRNPLWILPYGFNVHDKSCGLPHFFNLRGSA